MAIANLETAREDALLAEMIEQAQNAGKCTSGRAGEVIQKGNENSPSMIIGRLEHTDSVYIYNTQTGDRSICPRFLLPTRLKVKRPDGTRVFSTIKPAIEPKVGIYKCMLHPDNEKREHYDEIGLPVCKKSNIPSEAQLKMHMKKKHPAEWESIEGERLEAEKKEEREFQRSIIEMAKAGNRTPAAVKVETPESEDAAPKPTRRKINHRKK